MQVDNKEMIMRVSPFTAASATAAFLITIIAGAGQAQTAVDALRGDGVRTHKEVQRQSGKVEAPRAAESNASEDK